MRRAPVVAAVLVLCLAGCTNGDASGPTSTHSTPPETDTSRVPTTDPAGPPALPDAAKARTTAGAKAFVTYYADVLNYSWRTRTSSHSGGSRIASCAVCTTRSSGDIMTHATGRLVRGAESGLSEIHRSPVPRPNSNDRHTRCDDHIASGVGNPGPNRRRRPHQRNQGRRTSSDSLGRLNVASLLDVEGSIDAFFVIVASAVTLVLLAALDASRTVLRGTSQAVAGRHQCETAATAGSDRQLISSAPPRLTYEYVWLPACPKRDSPRPTMIGISRVQSRNVCADPRLLRSWPFGRIRSGYAPRALQGGVGDPSGLSAGIRRRWGRCASER